jgi:hypothetical protein
MTRLVATNATAEAVSIRRHHCQDSLVGMRREASPVTRRDGVNRGGYTATPDSGNRLFIP